MKITDEAVEAFTQYRRSQVAELRPWQSGDDMSGVSVSAEDAKAGSPRPGDMIARNPKNHADQWLVAAAYFADNFEPLAALHLSQGAVRVKPLEWGKTSYGSPEAPSIARTYRINEATDGGWAVAAGHEVLSDTDGRRNFASIDDAKAAAQADYERRVLSTLSPAPVGVTDENVRWEDVREFIYHRAEQLKSQTPRQVFWALADDMSRKLRGVRALKALASHDPAPTEGHRANRAQPGGCQLHNLHCGYPECDRRPAPTDTPEGKELGYNAHGNLTTFDARDDDTQEGVSEAGEVVSWIWRMPACEDNCWHVGPHPSVAIDVHPLVRQSALTTCQQEVERLRDERKGMVHEVAYRHAVARAETAEARIAELVKALEPFAREADHIEDLMPSVSDEMCFSPSLNVSVGELRRARAVLGGQSNE